VLHAKYLKNFLDIEENKPGPEQRWISYDPREVESMIANKRI
jgi:hypothetical protein